MDNAPRVRVVFITLDRHAAGAVEGAIRRLSHDLPGLRLDLHIASDWASDPSALTRCRADIASADVIIATMLFMEDHVEAVREAILARRETCDAVLACVSAAEIVKLTKLGRFSMSAKQSGPMALLKRLRGKSGAKGKTAGAGQMALLRQIPRFLRYIPGTAQDVRAYFISMQYWLAGSEDNLTNLVRFLVNRYAAGPRGALRGQLNVDDPVDYPDVGVYHPRLPGRIGTDPAQLPRFDDPSPGQARAGRVGLLLMRSYLLSNDTGHYDGVIAALEARGLDVVPAFACGLDGRPAVDAFFKDASGVTTVDAVISLTGFSLVGGPAYNDAEAAKAALDDLDVPYLSAHALEFQSLESWQASARGLMPVESTMMIAIPEIDGSTVPTVFGGRSGGKSQCGGCGRGCQIDASQGLNRMIVCAERAEQLARRAEKLVALRRAERRERKLAIVLFNFPPNAGATGTAAYLSVFQSLHNTLQRLADDGYDVEVPASTDDLRLALLEGNAASLGTDANVHTQISVDDHVAREPFLADIEAQWGPAPGRHLTNGRAIQVLGAQFGNIFVGVQPGFGYEGDPMRLLFEGSFAPTHAFCAFYRWLREDFGAHAVLHFGTHGALEFMPGKQTGLTDSCWPERLIGDLPNIYLYAANNPSEGAIAKRRSAATTVTYLTPSVARAGLYRGLADLKASLERYRALAPDAEDERVRLARLIAQQAADVDLVEQPPADATGALAPLEPAEITALNDAVLELEYTLIPHGLHVIGAPMSAAQRADLLHSVADASHGVDLPEDITAAIASGQSGEQALRSYAASGHAVGDTLKAAVATAATTQERLDDRAELDGLSRALDGRFVPPVAGGDVLRSIDVLPTGRNMHGFDPFRLPSAYAVEDGRLQAARLLERHLQDGNGLPETVAIVLWGADNLKSEGGPLSQALALLGAKPRFDSFGRLAGADLLSLDVLGRPRIDVAMTLSGIFRDLLPMQTRLLAEAAYLAASAEEAESDNFVRRHTLQFMRDHGCDLETAALRVFSNADGAYGSNVNQLIDSGCWNDEDELADAFESRKGFAYGRDGRPQEKRALLSSILSTADVAYQNLESVELGITTIDHYFDTLGGIGRAVRRAKGGEGATIYIGDQTRSEGKVRTLNEQVSLETRTRMLNPKWTEGMLDHGYEGVRQIEAHLSNTVGWSATTGEVAPWVYQQISETYVLDETMRERLAQLNPKSSARVARRLIEAHERNYWTPDAETLDALYAAGDELDDRLEGIGLEAAE